MIPQQLLFKIDVVLRSDYLRLILLTGIDFPAAYTLPTAAVFVFVDSIVNREWRFVYAWKLCPRLRSQLHA